MILVYDFHLKIVKLILTFNCIHTKVLLRLLTELQSHISSKQSSYI